VAAMEIYRWQLFRNRLDVRRRSSPTVDAPRIEHSVTSSKFAGLQVRDLEEIARMAHTGLNDLDRTVHDSFRALLPETSLGVRIGTAAEAVAAALCLFMVILTAYVRAAVNCEAPSTRGTVFSVLIGSRWFEAAGFVLICVPLAALCSLCVAIGWREATGYAVTALTLIVFLSTSSIIIRLGPHTSLGRLPARD
jgi:hypothetical protein